MEQEKVIPRLAKNFASLIGEIDKKYGKESNETKEKTVKTYISEKP